MFQDPTVVSVVKFRKQSVRIILRYSCSNFIYFFQYALILDTFSFDITQPLVTCIQKVMYIE